MSEAPELEATLWGEAIRLGLPVRPILMHTGWNVGPVAAYLFPHDPVTLLDAGCDNAESRAELEHAFSAAGLRTSDLRRVVVTHGHTDHYGCAAWLQEASGCEVLMHGEDIRALDARPARWKRLFAPLGIGPDVLRTHFGVRRDRPPLPARIGHLAGGEMLEAGGCRLSIEHRPGHSPGHIRVVDEATGAVFAGDQLLAHTPTNAGLEPDETHPLGRKPMLQLYEEGLREMAARPAPVVFPSHGPAIVGHAELIGRRLAKSRRRTDRVMLALKAAGETTPFDLVVRMVGERLAREPFGFIADVVGRLDILWADGRAAARRRDDGVWLFRAIV